MQVQLQAILKYGNECIIILHMQLVGDVNNWHVIDYKLYHNRAIR